MERFVYNKLVDWKKGKRRKPLLLRGARQVGKTWLVEKLAMEHFDYFLKIDFEKYPTLAALFEGDLNPIQICAELEIRTGVDVIPGKTLLFFDEIQNSPRAIMSLRYFYENMPELHVIAAGSLLEFVFSEISFPVGRIQMLEVFPLNFAEFLLALNFRKASEVVNSPISPVSNQIHDFLIEKLRTFWLTGGMPECVKVYSETQSLKQAFQVQDEIIESYRLDFNKYKPQTDVNCLNMVLTTVAASIGQQTKYTGLAHDYTIPTIRKAYESLLLAKVARKVKSVGNIGIPLEVNSSEKKFKNVFLDIGLMNRIMGLDYNETLNHSDLLAIYRGQLAEQYTGQEFVSVADTQLYYWSRDAKNSNAEVDYLLQINGEIFPVEVKDGSSGRLRSLHLYCENYKPTLSFVIQAGQFAILADEKIVFLPLYFAGSLAKYGYNEPR
jgi:predicted AAA+ superfamily ATPase